MGYWFILTSYISGRSGYSEARYYDRSEAERYAAIKRNRPEVKSAKVCYQPSLNEVDIKKFI